MYFIYSSIFLRLTQATNKTLRNVKPSCEASLRKSGVLVIVSEVQYFQF